MKYQLFLSVLMTAALTAAQNLNDLPSCATQPAIDNFSSSGCGMTDYGCLCGNSAFVDNLTTAIQRDCSAEDVQKVRKFANDLCSRAGVTLPSSTASVSTPVNTTATAAAVSSTFTGGAAARSEWPVGILASLGALNAAFLWAGWL